MTYLEVGFTYLGNSVKMSLITRTCHGGRGSSFTFRSNWKIPWNGVHCRIVISMDLQRWNGNATSSQHISYNGVNFLLRWLMSSFAYFLYTRTSKFRRQPLNLSICLFDPLLWLILMKKTKDQIETQKPIVSMRWLHLLGLFAYK